MMLTRSKKVLNFSINNLNLLDVELLQESEKFSEDGANKVLQWRTEAIENEKRRKY